MSLDVSLRDKLAAGAPAESESVWTGHSLDERGLGARVRVADPDDEREPADGDGGLGSASVDNHFQLVWG